MGRRTRLGPAVALAAALPLLFGAVGTGRAAPTPPAPTPPAATGIPDGAPAAAHRPAPALPVPAGWPFPEAFPRTSGTGRLAGGASFWSDYLYDDHGARGLPLSNGDGGGLVPPGGQYHYPAGDAKGNGADVFRTAVGRRGGATWWRVDWNTLLDPRVPIAAFGLDTDGNPATGAPMWPAGVGLKGTGEDAFLVVSAAGARIARTGQPDLPLAVTVDRGARSFLVRVPEPVLPPTGRWKVRLVSGLADGTGRGFAPATGARSGQTAVYDVGTDPMANEPPSLNFWSDNGQADALAAGAIAPFATTVDWGELAARKATPEPRPSGYSNRWYVSRLDLGQGVVPDAAPQGDLRPNYPGRVQPFGVYVPKSYDGTKAVPLTWVLHSLGMNHNQYGALSPKYLDQACEQRKSICATTAGRGPDGWYLDEAEVDFWEVWRELAATYSLDPERTVITGYSMGGYASYKLGLEYPDLFAKALPIAGPPMCGIRTGVPGLEFAARSGRCSTDGDTAPSVENARWLPFHITDGGIDQLVPVTGVVQHVQHFEDLGYRYRFELYPAEDHLAYSVQDGFSSAAAHMGTAARLRDPGHVTYSWFPHLADANLGIGPIGAYWVRDLAAGDSHPGVRARVDVDSGARPDPTVTAARTAGPLVPGDPTPGVYRELAWDTSAPGPRTNHLRVDLRNVKALRIDLGRAGFRPGEVALVHVTSDTPAQLTLASPDGSSTTYAVPAGVKAFTTAAPQPTAARASSGAASPSASAHERSRQARPLAHGGDEVLAVDTVGADRAPAHRGAVRTGPAVLAIGALLLVVGAVGRGRRRQWAAVSGRSS